MLALVNAPQSLTLVQPARLQLALFDSQVAR